MRFCGIDPGFKNMGVCIAEGDPFNIVFLDKVNIYRVDGVEYKYDPKHAIPLLKKYIERNRSLFESVDVFLIENQMARAMYRVQYGLEGLLQSYGRATCVHPATVKAYFKTSKKDYKKNKNAAVQYCDSRLAKTESHKFRKFTRGMKADDVADAIMLCQYAAQNSEALADTTMVTLDDHKNRKCRKRKRP